MESIDLSYNAIGDLGTLSFSRAIEINKLPNLRKLSLKEVGCSNSAIEKLLLSFQPETLIEYLDISGNSLLPVKKKVKKNSIKNVAPQIKSALQV